MNQRKKKKEIDVPWKMMEKNNFSMQILEIELPFTL
jgi:hypothetical protein